MKYVGALLVFALLLSMAAAAGAQQQTGDIYGRVVDAAGAVVPGTTVTVTGPALIQPRTAVTSESGTYRVAELPIGNYSVTFTLTGFRTIAVTGIRVGIAFRGQVNATLKPSAVEETVTVHGSSLLVGGRDTGTRTTFDLARLQDIPSARDPWVMLERTPGIVMDRANVGGNQSGQQSVYVSRGAGIANNKWSIDGVDITDMAATGASPIYYDFDMLEEMQVTTGGADVSQQTGGVGINLVTKSGTDTFKGNARFLVTDERLQDDNITDQLRRQGAGSGAPIQNIRDYGFDIGGPIAKGKSWFWSSYATQKVRAGVVGFYKTDPACRPGGAALDPTTIDTGTLRSCLESDLTTLNNYNWKLLYAPFKNNRLNFQNTWAEKVRNARDASDTRPIETTYRQKAVSSDFGPFGWLTGPSPLWKVGDQHVPNGRWLAEATWAHLGNNFVLDFHDDSLGDVQARQETTTGVWGRSFQASTFLRPTNSLDVTSSYFAPATLGGDHSLKFGYRWRSAHATSQNHHGGYIDARFTNGVANSADIWRDENSKAHLNTNALYIQDTFTRHRVTLNLGVRYDMQDDAQLAAAVPANPFFPALMPAIDFRGADAGVVWKDLSPRLGVAYDVTGDGRNVMSSSYATYYGQMAPGQLSGQLASTGAVFIRYPWSDVNGDELVQVGEVRTSEPFLAKSVAYDPAHPTATASPTRVDPDVSNDRTRELMVGFNRQLNSNIALGATYTWRHYDRFQWNDRDQWTSANYAPVRYTPTCPATARCGPVTYFEPISQVPSTNVYTNIPDRHRNFNGLEVTFTKRMAARWSMDGSVAYNSAIEHFALTSLEDPTCIAETCPGSFQYAPESADSGIGNVFPNAKWLVKMSGRLQLPYSINVAANYLGRQGFPFPQSILTPDRANGAGTAQVLLDPLGAVRYDNLHTLDFHVERTLRFETVTLIPALDVFNLTNANPVQAINRQQAADNANTVSGILAPRVARVGVHVRW